MLGAYIGYYESAEVPKAEIDPSSHTLPPDCLGHVKEPTKGCDSDSPQSEESYDHEESPQAEDNFDINEELLYKLQEAENTISALQDHLDSMNKDHFDLEQAMKKTFHKDRQRSKLECSRLQNALEDKDQQLFELARQQQIANRFWDDRQREINDLMNDVILNVKDMYRYQELCNLFNPNKQNTNL
ncbi:ABC transporter permease, putative [Babesia ovis]|uniref:ABC transporter permease, putative n=1 Tax=Babesia ovis TaxID=5869 RepID=A0A9W5TAW9_BABOV|nr:ABC transporter permease, putative [Babesia ovis]